MTETPVFAATGRRKRAVASVRLSPGSGQIIVNSRPLTGYFNRETASMVIEQPFKATESSGKFDVRADVRGGGLSGQAEAIRLGISRALLRYDPALRSALRSAGLLTRDARIKERKKYGLAGARKRYQFSKR
jgi:small subunit ribosomal protein S9